MNSISCNAIHCDISAERRCGETRRDAHCQAKTTLTAGPLLSNVVVNIFQQKLICAKMQALQIDMPT
jgi:hypothetical protein